VNTNNGLGKEPENLCFQRYYDSFFRGLHEWRDYQKISMGYGEWYYDCLPLDKTARILDIGCGDGKFLFYLQQKGFTRAEGLELSPQMANEASKHVNCPIQVVDNTIDFLGENPASFQTITMNDVLEHIPKSETINFLSAVKGALVPGGNAVVNVPQVAGFTSLYCRYNDFTHQTIFTEMSLRQVLSLAGYDHVRFVKEKWPLKLTPRHLTYRLARWVWHVVLRSIYFVEQPGEIHPQNFQIRLVASATRS